MFIFDHCLLIVVNTAANTEALAHQAANCPNCDTAVSGNFCHACGQETALHPPSTREFVHEFIGHYVALEGKLWKSLGLLLFRPGRLTLEYINGRRVRYIQPLRLYLTLSVIFFAVLQYSKHDLIHLGDGKPQSASVAGKEASPAAGQKSTDDDDDEQAASASLPAAAPDRTATPQGKHKLRKLAAEINPHWADRLAQLNDMSGEERDQLINNAFYHYVPYAVFFMMPLFALYLKVLYLGSGRRYGAHLLFALHTNGFAYLAFTLMWLVPKGFYLAPLLAAWLVFYLPTAMRRVYGGSRFVTALRWIVLMFLHLLTMAVAVAGALAFGIVH